MKIGIIMTFKVLLYVAGELSLNQFVNLFACLLK